MDPEEASLLRTASVSDFDRFYREHVRFVWRTARRLGVHPAAIEDAVQEVFVVVHRRLSDFESRSSPKTWLFGVVRRVAADHRRRIRRRPGDVASSQAGSLDDLEEGHVGPEQSAERAERVNLLHRILAGMDDAKLEVFILAELEQMSASEVAEALDGNPNTIKSRIRAARHEFEQALSSYESLPARSES
jgi:RNA polymerase sigma-70 factor, ECF subfamily